MQETGDPVVKISAWRGSHLLVTGLTLETSMAIAHPSENNLSFFEDSQEIHLFSFCMRQIFNCLNLKHLSFFFLIRIISEF